MFANYNDQIYCVGHHELTLGVFVNLKILRLKFSPVVWTA